MTLRSLRLVLSASLTALLAACAGGPSVTLSAADRAAIRTVSMREAPKVPEAMQFQARSMGAMFGLAGAAVEAAATRDAPADPASQLRAAMRSAGIDVGAILKDEFSRAAAARGAFVVQAGGEPAPAELGLVINNYGWGRTHLMGADLHPIVNVTATLRRPGGETIWQRTEFITPLNEQNKPGHEIEAMLKDPALIRQSLARAAAIVSGYLLDKY